jgi:hypothetical protein
MPYVHAQLLSDYLLLALSTDFRQEFEMKEIPLHPHRYLLQQFSVAGGSGVKWDNPSATSFNSPAICATNASYSWTASFHLNTLLEGGVFKYTKFSWSMSSEQLKGNITQQILKLLERHVDRIAFAFCRRPFALLRC